MAKSVARLEDGNPASPVGELIDAIVKEVETTNQYTSTALAGRLCTTPRSKGTLVACTWSSIRKELMGDPQRLNVTVSSSAARCVCAELTFMDVSS